jgi:hypothetical protein
LEPNGAAADGFAAVWRFDPLAGLGDPAAQLRIGRREFGEFR